MKCFTIDPENNITIHASRKAARDTGAAVFANEGQFADLIGPNPKRLVEIWNTLPGVQPVTKFANRKAATERIWTVIQGLGEGAAAAPAAEPRVGSIVADTAMVEAPTAETANGPVAEPMATVGAQPPDVTPKEARSANRATRSKKAPTGEPKPKEAREPARRPATVGVPAAEPAIAPMAESIAALGAQSPDVAPKQASPANRATRSKKAPTSEPKPKEVRDGSKAAQVVAMLQRNNGATLAEIMDKMGWQKHTVRGFMAGAMKKAGYLVESFKSAEGDRTYRINR